GAFEVVTTPPMSSGSILMSVAVCRALMPAGDTVSRTAIARTATVKYSSFLLILAPSNFQNMTRATICPWREAGVEGAEVVLRKPKPDATAPPAGMPKAGANVVVFPRAAFQLRGALLFVVVKGRVVLGSRRRLEEV